MIETGPIRKVGWIDARKYLKRGRKLLGQMEQQLALSGQDQGWMEKRYSDGVKIIARSMFGQKSVKIVARFPGKVFPKLAGRLVGRPHSQESGTKDVVIYTWDEETQTWIIWYKEDWEPVYGSGISYGLVDWKSLNEDVLTVAKDASQIIRYMGYMAYRDIYYEGKVHCLAPSQYFGVSRTALGVFRTIWFANVEMLCLLFFNYSAKKFELHGRIWSETPYANDDPYDKETNPNGWQFLQETSAPYLLPFVNGPVDSTNVRGMCFFNSSGTEGTLMVYGGTNAASGYADWLNLALGQLVFEFSYLQLKVTWYPNVCEETEWCQTEGCSAEIIDTYDDGRESYFCCCDDFLIGVETYIDYYRWIGKHYCAGRQTGGTVNVVIQVDYDGDTKITMKADVVTSSGTNSSLLGRVIHDDRSFTIDQEGIRASSLIDIGTTNPCETDCIVSTKTWDMEKITTDVINSESRIASRSVVLEIYKDLDSTPLLQIPTQNFSYKKAVWSLVQTVTDHEEYYWHQQIQTYPCYHSVLPDVDESDVLLEMPTQKVVTTGSLQWTGFIAIDLRVPFAVVLHAGDVLTRTALSVVSGSSVSEYNDFGCYTEVTQYLPRTDQFPASAEVVAFKLTDDPTKTDTTFGAVAAFEGGACCGNCEEEFVDCTASLQGCLATQGNGLDQMIYARITHIYPLVNGTETPKMTKQVQASVNFDFYKNVLVSYSGWTWRDVAQIFWTDLINVNRREQFPVLEYSQISEETDPWIKSISIL